MKVSRIEEMRDLDRSATEKYGISEEILMENAGDASYFVILTEMGVKGRKAVLKRYKNQSSVRTLENV